MSVHVTLGAGYDIPVVESSSTVPASDVTIVPSDALFNRERGYVAVPRGEIIAFFQQQAITFGVGFSIGLLAGALFNIQKR